jgi:mono/diheme cytochrome c family protein
MKVVTAKIADSAVILYPIACLFLLVCPVALAQNSPARVAKEAGRGNEGAQSAEARGRYIVEDVAVCTQCHTPRDGQGNLDRNKWLEGAPLWLQPARPTQDWPLQAPRIAGDPPGTDAEMIRLLTTGIWRDGKPLRQPMPQFRLSASDARAVVAYLKSLNPQH